MLMIRLPNRWPLGLGAQYLYDLQVNLVSGILPVDTMIKRIGLRTVELIREGDQKEESFYFRQDTLTF